MSEATVKAHISRVLTKLNATNRVQVAIMMRDAGLTLAELEWHVRVRVERVGQGDTVVPVRDENQRQLLPGQHLLQVSQHARVRQRQRVALGSPQDTLDEYCCYLRRLV